MGKSKQRVLPTLVGMHVQLLVGMHVQLLVGMHVRLVIIVAHVLQVNKMQQWRAPSSINSGLHNWLLLQ